MPLQTENLAMIGLGISNDIPPNFIQPQLIDGIHLRWAFKRERGFPWYGYYLFRREHGTPDIKVSLGPINFSPPAANQPGTTKWNSAAGELSSDSDLILSDFPPVNPTSTGFDLNDRTFLKFIPSTLIYWTEITIGFIADAEIGITVYLGSMVVKQVFVKGKTNDLIPVKIEADSISSIVIDSGAAVLIELVCEPVTVGYSWQPVPNFPNPMSLPVAHANYPCSGAPTTLGDAETTALNRILYGASGQWAGTNFNDLYNELQKLVAGGPAAGVLMAEIVSALPSAIAQPNMPNQFPLDLVLLGALHPAIAQMIGLYWVDNPPDPNMLYDYMIVADHKSSINPGNPVINEVFINSIFQADPDAIDVYIIYNKSMLPSTAPLSVPQNLKSYALPGGAMQASASLTPPQENNAGLRWDLELSTVGVLQPTSSLMYHIWRSELGNADLPAIAGNYTPITETSPVLVVESVNPPIPKTPNDWPPERLYYIDSGLADGWYSYQISGIDIFGRHSSNSVASPWLQWTPPPTTPPIPPIPLPWYYITPAPVDSIVHPSAVRLRDVIPPPPPTAVEAFALDPADPLILKDAAYDNWFNALSPVKKSLIGLRVKWSWTHVHMRQAPDVNEFRIYYQPDSPNPINSIAGNITSMIPSGATESTVVTTIADTQPADTYKEKWLQVGPDAFKILTSNSAGGVLNLKIANIGPNKDIKPLANLSCLISLPTTHPNYTDYSKTENWQTRLHVNGYDVNVTPRLIPVFDPSTFTLKGVSATITTNQVSLDGAPNLSGELINASILIANDTVRVNQSYNILAVDNVAKTVTVDGNPIIAAPSVWKINYRKSLLGVNATNTAGLISLDGVPDLSGITLSGEHIYLESDTNRPDKTYLIVAIDQAGKTITVDGSPVITGIGSAWSIGFPQRDYEVFLPTIDNTNDEGVPLVTSSSEPIRYAYITVSAADSQASVSDKRPPAGNWSNRSGNEGPAGAKAKIFRVHRELPVAPAIPEFETERVYATKADYHSHSFYTFRWIPIAGLKTHIYRALDYSVFQADWETRRELIESGAPFILSGTDSNYIPPELQISDPVDPVIDLRRNDLVAKINALNNIASDTPFNEVMATYNALTDDALRVLAALPGNEVAFTQLTIQALDAAEVDPDNAALKKWRNRVGPDNPTNFPVDANQLSFLDTLDGRSTNRYFYRAGSVDGAHNRSKVLSLSTPPVYCPNVVPPKRPVLLQANGGAKMITLQWMENIEEDLDHYELYRTNDIEATRDVRLMLLHKKIAKSPNSILTPDEIAPAQVLNEVGNPIPRRLKITDVVLPNTNFHYLLIAVDTNNNKSEASQIVSGRAYQLPPDPPDLSAPIWDVAHNQVTLNWSSVDSSLRSLVESKEQNGLVWRAVSDWLLPGQYTFIDEPFNSNLVYEYRIKVRDSLGQINCTYKTQFTI